jgi:hypothetical protein
MKRRHFRCLKLVELVAFVCRVAALLCQAIEEAATTHEELEIQRRERALYITFLAPKMSIGPPLDEHRASQNSRPHFLPCRDLEFDVPRSGRRAAYAQR